VPAASELFQDLILDHFRRPRGWGVLDAPDRDATRTNPLCGESIHLTVALDGDRVRDIRFEGETCAVARASASMMTQLVTGRSRAEIASLALRLRAILRRGAADDPGLGDLRALAPVARTPARVPCALLAWDTLALTLADVPPNR
jgi:nitrogen fixation NifU-like protein